MLIGNGSRLCVTEAPGVLQGKKEGNVHLLKLPYGS